MGDENSFKFQCSLLAARFAILSLINECFTITFYLANIKMS